MYANGSEMILLRFCLRAEQVVLLAMAIGQLQVVSAAGASMRSH